MSRRTPFDTLRRGLTIGQRANVEAKAAALRQEMTLAELRQARELTQENLGQTLQVGQAAIAKMEKRADMYVGSLRRFVQAMGGELEIVARFPDGIVKIINFADAGGPSVQS